MSKLLKIGSRKHTQVYILDEPGNGGANNQYSISTTSEPSTILGLINFQNGSIREQGVNGIMNEDLIAIVIDRIRGFQSGKYSCRENAIALTKLEEALMWLRKRTDA